MSAREFWVAFLRELTGTAEREREAQAARGLAANLVREVTADRDRARRIAVELEQQNAEALAILAERDCRDENGMPQILGAVQRAVDVLRGEPQRSPYRTWREVRAEGEALRAACSGGAAIDHDETGVCEHTDPATHRCTPADCAGCDEPGGGSDCD